MTASQSITEALSSSKKLQDWVDTVEGPPWWPSTLISHIHIVGVIIVLERVEISRRNQSSDLPGDPSISHWNLKNQSQADLSGRSIQRVSYCEIGSVPPPPREKLSSLPLLLPKHGEYGARQNLKSRVSCMPDLQALPGAVCWANRRGLVVFLAFLPLESSLLVRR